VKGEIFTVIDRFLEAKAILLGIGIGCTGPLDTARGVIRNPYTLPGWGTVSICAIFQRRYNCTVQLENDADCALLGEIFARRNVYNIRNAIMLTFGTGVGGAVLLNGKLFKSETFGHPEFGHIIVAPGEGECYCGRSGCLESVASGSALSKGAKELGYRNFYDLVEKGGLLTEGRALVERWSEYVGRALWTFAHIFAPSLIIFTGGVVESLFSITRTKIIESLEEGRFFGDFTLEQSVLGLDAGMVGAATLILSELIDND